MGVEVREGGGAEGVVGVAVEVEDFCGEGGG